LSLILRGVDFAERPFLPLLSLIATIFLFFSFFRSAVKFVSSWSRGVSLPLVVEVVLHKTFMLCPPFFSYTQSAHPRLSNFFPPPPLLLFSLLPRLNWGADGFPPLLPPASKVYSVATLSPFSFSQSLTYQQCFLSLFNGILFAPSWWASNLMFLVFLDGVLTPFLQPSHAAAFLRGPRVPFLSSHLKGSFLSPMAKKKQCIFLSRDGELRSRSRPNRKLTACQEPQNQPGTRRFRHLGCGRFCKHMGSPIK